MLDKKYKNKIIDLDKKYFGRSNWLSKIAHNIETIKAAAISINGRIFTGRSHAEAFMKAFKILEGIDLMSPDGRSSDWNKYAKWLHESPVVANRSEGFVTSRRRFVSREKAFEIAEIAEQLREKADVYQNTSLISEYVK